MPLAVNRGGVEERDSQVDCPMDRADRLIVVAGAYDWDMLMHPSPIADTSGPPVPSCLFSIAYYLQLTGPHTRASHCGMIVR